MMLHATLISDHHLTMAEPTQPRREPMSKRGRAVVTAIVVALAVALFWFWNRGPEQRALRHLPEGERRALYERTLRTLKSPCDNEQRTEGLERFCSEQAEFILEFPECDQACAALARRHLSTPSR